MFVWSSDDLNCHSWPRCFYDEFYYSSLYVLLLWSIPFQEPGWLGWAMVLGSFQCRSVLLLLHIVGQGPAVLAAGAGRVGYILYIYFFFHLSSISNVLSFGRRLNRTEIL